MQLLFYQKILETLYYQNSPDVIDGLSVKNFLSQGIFKARAMKDLGLAAIPQDQKWQVDNDKLQAMAGSKGLLTFSSIGLNLGMNDRVKNYWQQFVKGAYQEQKRDDLKTLYRDLGEIFPWWLNSVFYEQYKNPTFDHFKFNPNNYLPEHFKQYKQKYDALNLRAKSLKLSETIDLNTLERNAAEFEKLIDEVVRFYKDVNAKSLEIDAAQLEVSKISYAVTDIESVMKFMGTDGASENRQNIVKCLKNHQRLVSCIDYIDGSIRGFKRDEFRYKDRSNQWTRHLYDEAEYRESEATHRAIKEIWSEIDYSATGYANDTDGYYGRRLKQFSLMSEEVLIKQFGDQKASYLQKNQSVKTKADYLLKNQFFQNFYQRYGALRDFYRDFLKDTLFDIRQYNEKYMSELTQYERRNFEPVFSLYSQLNKDKDKRELTIGTIEQVLQALKCDFSGDRTTLFLSEALLKHQWPQYVTEYEQFKNSGSENNTKMQNDGFFINQYLYCQLIETLMLSIDESTKNIQASTLPEEIKIKKMMEYINCSMQLLDKLCASLGFCNTIDGDVTLFNHNFKELGKIVTDFWQKYRKRTNIYNQRQLNFSKFDFNQYVQEYVKAQSSYGGKEPALSDLTLVDQFTTVHKVLTKIIQGLYRPLLTKVQKSQVIEETRATILNTKFLNLDARRNGVLTLTSMNNPKFGAAGEYYETFGAQLNTHSVQVPITIKQDELSLECIFPVGPPDSTAEDRIGTVVSAIRKVKEGYPDLNIQLEKKLHRKYGDFSGFSLKVVLPKAQQLKKLSEVQSALGDVISSISK